MKEKREEETGGSVEDGLSSRQPLDKAYEPRKSGQGQRPAPPAKSKKGGFTIC